MTGILILLGISSIVYGVYVHNAASIKNMKDNSKIKEKSKNATETGSTVENTTAMNPKKSSLKYDGVTFAEVFRDNLSTKELQKDTLEKLIKQYISLEEAAKIMVMDKGEVLLLKNIYINYQK
jgi:hypothetical protein